MKFAIAVPNFGDLLSNPRAVIDLAVNAEEAGWDGFFLWDHIGSDWREPVADPWSVLAAIAVCTDRLVLGTTVTPLPRRRPWKLARETTTVDHLSRGRLRLGVGIGSDARREYSCFGELADDRVHAAMLDEGLAVLTGLWTGQPFSFHGRHYDITNALFLPPPVQQPRIPIWVAGTWPNTKPFQRAAKWDGVCPIGRYGLLSPFEVHEIVHYIARFRSTANPFDVVCAGTTSGTNHRADRDRVIAYANAGATWWIETLGPPRGNVDQQRLRIGAGPPQVD